MFFKKLNSWVEKIREDHKNKEKERIKSVILSLLLTDRGVTLTHLEQAEILSSVVEEFKQRKEQESVLSSRTMTEVQQALSLLR